MYTRICPKCKKELTYKNIISYNKAVKENWCCRSCANNDHKKITTNLKRLLSDELEAFYWIGFILADGHISNKKRLSICISETDIEHLQKISNYINVLNIKHHTTNNHNYVSINAQDSVYCPKIVEKFDINTQKTYYPPKLKTFTGFKKEQMLSLIIGFVDGDGSIQKQYKRMDCILTIKTHSAWMDVLNLFSSYIVGKHIAKIDNRGYAKIMISETNALIKLKKFAIEHNLPILKRKWDKIDVNYITFYDVANERLNKIKTLAENGLTINEITRKLDLSYNGVYMAIKRHKIQVKLEK